MFLKTFIEIVTSSILLVNIDTPNRHWTTDSDRESLLMHHLILYDAKISYLFSQQYFQYSVKGWLKVLFVIFPYWIARKLWYLEDGIHLSLWRIRNWKVICIEQGKFYLSEQFWIQSVLIWCEKKSYNFLCNCSIDLRQSILIECHF